MKRVLALLLISTLFLAACGDDDTSLDASDDTSEDGSTTTSGDSSVPSTPASDLPEGVTIVSVSEDLEVMPEVELEGTDEAPTEVIIEDTVVGDGAEVAEGDTVEVQYLGLLTDGTEFDSSWSRGETAEFGLDQVITGWGEGLVGMKEGGRRVLVIPADKAYGDAGQGTIPPGATLVFVVDLVSVVVPPTAGVTVDSVSTDLEVAPEVVLSPSDEAPTELVIDDVVVGDGEAVPEDGDPRVSVQYVGQLTNGKEFDSSWPSRGAEPAQFNLSQVIPGWDEGLRGMKVGGRRTLVIPAELAYGAEGTPDGTIPPGATLVFVVDLLEIDPEAPTTTGG